MKNKLKVAIAALLCQGILFSCNQTTELNMDLPPMEEHPENGKVIPNQYIVVLHDKFINFRKGEGEYDEMQAAYRKEMNLFLKSHKISEDNIEQVYVSAFTGFSARLDVDQLARIKNDPMVNFIEEDRIIALRPPWESEKPEEINTQVIPYGIKRVKGGETYKGRNVVFVLDTGVDVDHVDLNVDIKHGFTSFYDKKGGNRNQDKRDYNDGHGHGTHVAGTIAAIDNHFGVVGVAAGATVVPVKVLDDYGRGSNSTVIAGIDFVGHRGKKGDVANMSIGGPPSLAVDQAVINASERKGVWFVIASGNSASHANTMSPQRLDGKYTITVASINSRDQFSWFSNYGKPPVDFAAPGEAILSTGINNTYYNSSGTSMAAPHIAGLRLLGEIDIDGYALNSRDGLQYPIVVRKF